MRKLNTPDVFKAFRLLTKSGLKDKLQGIIDDVAKNGFKSIEDVGITGLMAAIETLTDEKCERLFYELLSGPYELTPQEVAELDLENQIEMLTKLYEENNLKSFFSALSGLMKTKS